MSFFEHIKKKIGIKSGKTTAEEPNKNVYRKLSPIAVDTPELESAFDFVFSDKDVTNVAVCGDYGSGKSSVVMGAIARQEKSNEELKWITVSLARFRDLEDERVNSRTSNHDADDELALEAALLSQIVHQIDPSHAKHSKLLKSRAIPWRRKAVLFGGITLFVLMFVYYRNPDTINLFFPDGIIPIASAFNLVFLACSVIAVVGCLLFGDFFSRLIHRLEIPGIGSAELFHPDGEKEPSTLDKYLDDILYLIKTTKIDVVIYEDLDRWGNTRILEKLRQINILLNSSSVLSKRKGELKPEKPVRFFYLVRSDIFTNEDQVKFFDYIITVLPYSDYNSAANRLMLRLEEDGFALDPELLSVIGHRVMDNRLLNNIVNEFHQFRAWCHIESSALEVNKRLFCLVVYKNLYPSDFAGLQVGKGYLHTVLHSRRELVERIVFAATQESTDDAEEERVALRQSLHTKTIGAILAEYPDLEDDFFFLCFLDDSESVSCDIGNDTLVRYLIKNRCIEEHYWAYISRAQGIMLSLQDSLFVHTVVSGGKTSPLTKLDNPKGIIDSLSAPQFAMSNIRVYELVSVLLNGSHKGKENSFFEGLRSDEDSKFVMNYLRSGLCNAKAIVRIEKSYPEGLFADNDISELEVAELRALIKVVLDATASVNELGPGLRKRLKRLVSKDREFLALVKQPEDHLLAELSDLNVELIDIDLGRTSIDVLNQAIELGLFYPSLSMIIKLFSRVNGIDSVLPDRILSIVFENINTPLGDSVNRKLPTFLSLLMHEKDFDPKDTSDTVSWVLNHENVEEELKNQYIELVPTRKLGLSSVDEAYWELLLNTGVAEFTIGNIVCYYDEYAGAFDSSLITFFNDFVKPGVINQNTVSGLNKPVVFLEDLNAQEKIEDETFEKVFQEYGEIPDEISLGIFTEKRLSILFAYGCVSMTASRLSKVRKQYSQYLDSYIHAKTDKYLNLVIEGIVLPQESEILAVLGDDRLDDEQKKEILQYSDGQFSISAKYSDELNSYLICNHLDNGDLDVNLGKLYGSGSVRLQNEIVNAVKNSCKGGYYSISLPYKAILRVLEDESLSDASKIGLLKANLKQLSPKEVEACLRVSGFNNEANLMHGGSKKIKPSETEKELIAILQDFDYLGCLNPIRSDPGSYMLYGKRVIKS